MKCFKNYDYIDCKLYFYINNFSSYAKDCYHLKSDYKAVNI